MRTAYEFFQAHSDEGYSKGEMAKVWPKVAQDATERSNLENAVDALVRVGALESRWVGSEGYYAFSKDVDPETWAEPRATGVR